MISFLGKIGYENYKAIAGAVIVFMFGGVIGCLTDGIFTTALGLFALFVFYVMRKSYERKYIKKG